VKPPSLAAHRFLPDGKAGRCGQDIPQSKDSETAMPDHVYKVVELVGSSRTSIEDAINTAISKANETIRLMRWFEVVETRGHIENGKVAHYQVTLKVGFTMEDK
jgi:flavin-binding protein dodecin